MGLTAADLKIAGTIPVDSEEWVMADIRGSREERQRNLTVQLKLVFLCSVLGRHISVSL